MNKNKRAFTLIELIVVMAIIGILVLLATPKFLNYIEMARLTNIINDTKVAENLTIAHMARFNGELPEWAKYPIEDGELYKYLIEGKVYTVKGKIGEDGLVEELILRGNYTYAEDALDEDLDLDLDGEYFIIEERVKKAEIRSRLKGTFLIDKDGFGVYVDDKLEAVEELPEEPQDVDDSIFEFGEPEDWDEYDKTISVIGFKDEYKYKHSSGKKGNREELISLTGKNAIPREVIKDGVTYRVNTIGGGDSYIEHKYEEDKEIENIDWSYNRKLKVESFKKGAFYDQGITGKIFINNDIELISPSSFANNKINKIEFEDSKNAEDDIFMIEEGVFAYNEDLKLVDLPKRLLENFLHGENMDGYPSEYTFYNCGIERVNFPKIPHKEGVDGYLVSIGFEAFAYNNIKQLELPHYIYDIESRAFYNNEIEKIVFNRDSIQIASAAFANNNLKDLKYYGDDTKMLEDGILINPIGRGVFRNSNLNNDWYRGLLEDDIIREIDLCDYTFVDSDITEIEINSKIINSKYNSLGRGTFAVSLDEDFNRSKEGLKKITMNIDKEWSNGFYPYPEGVDGVIRYEEDSEGNLKEVYYSSKQFEAAYEKNNRVNGTYVKTNKIDKDAVDKFMDEGFTEEEAKKLDVYIWELE